MDAGVTTQEAVDALVRNAAPPQGCWSDSDYLWLAGHTTRLVELTDGSIEVLPRPTETHQLSLMSVYTAFADYLKALGGTAIIAPFPLRIREGKYREPDILVLRDAGDPRRADARWTGADLVVETVSPDDPRRDYVVKRSDYAEAGIPEYWIVDPRREVVTVLALGERAVAGDAYVEHGVHRRGDTARSATFDGFSVQVDAVFDFGPPASSG